MPDIPNNIRIIGGGDSLISLQLFLLFMLFFNVVNAQITNNLVSDGTFTCAAPAASNP